MEPRDIWTKLTSHNAIIIYIIILLSALTAIMLLMIFRAGKDIRAREAAKKKQSLKKRFSRLAELDAAKEPGDLTRPYNRDLKQLCDDFRNFAASKMGLYYDIRTIRAFVSSLGVTRLIILQGISGTGKTSLPYAFGKFAGNEAVVVPVQPSWKDKTDMLGYYNEFTDTFTESELLTKLYEANLKNGIYMTVLDEMNIARVEYYFAEFLSLLELPDPSARKMEVISSRRDNDPRLLKGGKLLIPENVWFTGTANNDDSTLAISDKVYDRAMILELSRRADPFSAPDTEAISISYEELNEKYRKAKVENKLSDSARMKIDQLDEFLSERMQITFGNRIMRQTEEFVPVYIAAGGNEEEAIDLIICKKVLRKLENQNPVFVSGRIQELLDTFTDIFGENAMPMCREYAAGFLRS